MATFVGTDNADTLNATADGDVLLGNGGNDTLNGFTGAEVLNGGAGNDSMTGGTGNDTYYVDAAGDIVREAVNGGSDTVASSVNYTLAPGSEVEALYFNNTFTASTATAGGAANATTVTTGVAFTGNEFAQSIYGTGGADFLAGGRNSNAAAGDTLDGGAGDDTYLVSNVNTLLVDTGGNDTVFVSITDLEASGQAVATYSLGTVNGAVAIETISAQSQRDTQNFSLTGNATAQKVIGNFGANTLNGGGGADTLIGLDGNDTYQIVTGAEVIQETTGTDRVIFDPATTITSYQLAADVSIESITASGTVHDVAGNNLAQTITGTATADTIRGGGGGDTLVGLAGNDTYVITDSAAVITEATDGGSDGLAYVGTTGGYNLADGVSVEFMSAGVFSAQGAAAATDSSGTSSVYLVGNELAQTIFGNRGNNILDADNGNSAAGVGDTLYGGDGNDIYRVYSQNDQVFETQQGNNAAAAMATGNDTVFTSASYVLGAAGTIGSIETLSAANQAGTEAINLTGNATAQRLIGNNGANTLTSGTANTGATATTGGDTLIGLGGNDTYVLTNQADVVTEAVGGGTDVINFGAGYTASSYALAAGSEVDQINLSGTVLTFTGNEFGQVINGSTTAANETITGGGGADLLQGGLGDDTYIIADNLAVVRDTDGSNVVQYSGTTGGYNIGNASTVTSISATGTFAAGSAGVFLVGNNLVQTITGGAGSDILNGNGGTTDGGRGDSLVGGDGNDTYRVYTSNLAGNGTASTTVGDQVVEASATGGNDTVYTSASFVLSTNVENLIAADQANVTTLTLVGNGLNNVISGSNGNNVLVGGAGNDTLTGLGGADTFHFNTAFTGNAANDAANADTIADFNASQGDRISLDATTFAATGTAAGFNGAVDGMEFQMGTVATGSQATILYDQATGRIFFDSDGAGTAQAELFATVSAGTALSASNFVITPAGTLPTP